MGLVLRDILFFSDSQPVYLGSDSELFNFHRQKKIFRFLEDYHPLGLIFFLIICFIFVYFCLFCFFFFLFFLDYFLCVFSRKK